MQCGHFDRCLFGFAGGKASRETGKAVGADVEVIVLEVDPSGRRIRLSAKAVIEAREAEEVREWARLPLPRASGRWPTSCAWRSNRARSDAGRRPYRRHSPETTVLGPCASRAQNPWNLPTTQRPPRRRKCDLAYGRIFCARDAWSQASCARTSFFVGCVADSVKRVLLYWRVFASIGLDKQFGERHCVDAAANHITMRDRRTRKGSRLETTIGSTQ